jgi:hypothetical protein
MLNDPRFECDPTAIQCPSPECEKGSTRTGFCPVCDGAPTITATDMIWDAIAWAEARGLPVHEVEMTREDWADA